MAVQLVRPHARFEASYARYIEELGNEERYPFPLDFTYASFAELLTKLQRFADGVELPAGFVPSTTFWLVEGDELVGVSSLRHFLNERIREAGGHIGLGIRPAWRGRGLGNELLRLTLTEARARGLEEVYVHCHKHNEASARTIRRNGGVLHSEVALPGEHDLVQRYLITLSR